MRCLQSRRYIFHLLFTSSDSVEVGRLGENMSVTRNGWNWIGPKLIGLKLNHNSIAEMRQTSAAALVVVVVDFAHILLYAEVYSKLQLKYIHVFSLSPIVRLTHTKKNCFLFLFSSLLCLSTEFTIITALVRIHIELWHPKRSEHGLCAFVAFVYFSFFLVIHCIR